MALKRFSFLFFYCRIYRRSTFHWCDWLSSVHDDLLIQSLLGLAPLDPLPGRDSPFVEVEIKYPDLAVEATVPAVSAKPGATGIAHPECRLFGGVLGGEGAVLVCVVTR